MPVMKARCTFMVNSWKRCEQKAGADGRCGAHGTNSPTHGDGFRHTSAKFNSQRTPPPPPPTGPAEAPRPPRDRRVT